MPEVRIPALEVVYKEMFVMQPLYRMTRQWLMENEYVDSMNDISLESSMEILYLYKNGTQMSPQERELRIWWRTQKRGLPVASASRFYEHHIDIDWNVINMFDREIMRNGKKEKVQAGELRVVIRPFLVVKDLSKTPILKFFNAWFMTRMVKKNLEENRKMIYQDAYRLQNTIKKYLELKSFLPKEDVFHEKFEFI